MTHSPEAPGPLEGVTVIDVTRVLAGPYASMVLSDLGATVIKVEAPGSGDDSRGFGPVVGGTSTYFASVNRGKKSIALDLKAPDDRAILMDLLATADVLLENFRPGVMEKLGLSWEELAPKFPQLIYGSVSGFGQTGPYRDRAAYDIVVQAMGGMMSVTGPEDGPPARVGTSIGDVGAGAFLALGVTSALYARSRSGKGRRIDISMLDCQVALLENAVTRYGATGELPRPMGSKHPLIAPFQAFRTADDWLVIAAGNDRLFARFTTAIGRAELAQNPLFLRRTDRQRHHQALEIEIELTLATRSRDEWLSLLQAEGIPCGPIRNVADLMEDPQLAARQMICETRDSAGQRFQVVGNPVKISGYDDPPERGAVPDLDQHRDEILTALYGRPPAP